ncbi:unnamed protein product [Adineta ricciae]|uniref:Uncharacterized protein n=1 Tax=Adineta ricciae TaxID=249248 RepID=A0A814PZ60_ADIRI|nr:unnamed protein product [Adineta ricciae]CAF1113011.1 unnamed protein product [Adineta ricciae]
MSTTPGLGAFNRDKVANKFGIQLKPKDAPSTKRPSTSAIDYKPTATTSTTTAATTGLSIVSKNKTINDFRTEKNTNGFLSTSNHSPVSKPIPDKVSTSKSTSNLLNTSVESQRKNSLTTNVNHSTTKSREPSPAPLKRAVSPAPPVKKPTTSSPKTEAQIEHQKDQPLYRRQLSKPLENHSSTANVPATTTTTTKTPPPVASPAASTGSLRR